MRKRLLAGLFLLELIVCASGAISEPTVNAGRTVTFTLRVPTASEVSVTVANLAEPVPMTRGANGMWTATVVPLKPNVWEYAFIVDGIRMIDRSNSWVDERINLSTNLFEVEGTEPSFWSVRDVPHGTVSMHTYKSPALGEMRTFHVYTPPGYNRGGSETYPVFYLFHGSGNDDRGWTVIGRAHYIMDNFIADGSAVPMIIVIPNGQYPRNRNGYDFGAYERDLLDAIIPAVEREYRVKTDRGSRAMAGFSMGGFQTLHIGVKHQEMFDWLGSFSGGVEETYEKEYSRYLDTLNDRVSLLWVGNGDNDDVIRTRHDTMTEMFDRRKVIYTFELYSGGHTWDVWRQCFRDFTPLLFKNDCTR